MGISGLKALLWPKLFDGWIVTPLKHDTGLNGDGSGCGSIGGGWGDGMSNAHNDVPAYYALRWGSGYTGSFETGDGYSDPQYVWFDNAKPLCITRGMATPESKVKARAVAHLKAADVYYFFPATHGYGRSGVPDIICCVAGWFLAIECKSGTGKPTALQVREMQRIGEAGGFALVVRETNVDTLPDLIKLLKEDTKNL